MTHKGPICANETPETDKLLSIFFEGNTKHSAQSYEQLALEVRALIEAGGDLNALDSNHSTVFMAAIDPNFTSPHDYLGYKNWLSFLLKYKPDIYHQNTGGFGAFFWAYSDAGVEQLRVLFELGIPAFQPTKEHGTIMDEAIRKGQTHKFQFMLDKWHEAHLDKTLEEKTKQYEAWIKYCDYMENDWIASPQQTKPDYIGIKNILVVDLEKNMLLRQTPQNEKNETLSPTPASKTHKI